MNEQLMQYLWQYQYFNKQSLVLNSGNKFQVIHPGRFNANQWPDFLEAKIKIDDTLWIGHVALHLKSSDLIKNEYQSNLKYNNLLLHVVWENDQPDVKSRIPIFLLLPQVSFYLLPKAQSWMNMESIISYGSQEQILESDENAQQPDRKEKRQKRNTKENKQKNVNKEHTPGNLLNNCKEQDSIVKPNDFDDEMKIIKCLDELKSLLRKKPPIINGKIHSLKIVTWLRDTSNFQIKYGGYCKPVPRIMLLGNWLTKAGFSCEDMVNVIPLTNMLIIIPQKQ